MFHGRTLLIATNHGKERVIAPLLERSLGVTCVVAADLNTDFFGTFSGEVERQHDPITTLRNKCLKAMELYRGDLAVASEGSFGPHPSLFFIPADDELVFLYDAKNHFEILEREITTDTNFNAEEITNINQLREFTSLVNFPSHGVIVRKSKDDYTELTKGIIRWNSLRKKFKELIGKYGSAYLETDMRAMYNPTRMKVIETATQKLVERINSLCPVCKAPGFGVTHVKRGLPCSACGKPTRSVNAYHYTCEKCSYATEYPVEISLEDPRHCDNCNP